VARGKTDMKPLIEQRDRLLREMEAIRNKVAGLEMAISLLETPSQGEVTPRSSKSVKAVLIDLLQESGTSGLNASLAVELANRRGVTLKPSSVSATLSRFKADGLVDYSGDRYRLKEFVSAPESSSTLVAWTNRGAA
jgi:hypothetical protein